MKRRGEKNLNRKISRITLLIPILVFSIFIGAAVTMQVTSTTYQSSNQNVNDEESCIQIPANYRIYEVLSPEGCYCLATGNTYADTEAPEVVVKSPPNNSLILVDTIIYIEATDNFPGEPGVASNVPFVPTILMYNWNETTNITIYEAAVDGAPPNDEPVKVELTLPNDDEGVTHFLYIYAVDSEGNWISLVFLFSTPGTGEESSVTWTTTTPPLTTTPPRRTDGFLLIPMILILIGTVNIITWRRRNKEY